MQKLSTLHTRGRRINHRAITLTQGTEGPKHDPYGWSAIQWRGSDFGVRLKQSALGYIRISVLDGNGKEIWHEQADDTPQAQQLYITNVFEPMSGVPFDYAQAVLQARDRNAVDYDRMYDYV